MNPKVAVAGGLLALACTSCVGRTSPSSPSSASKNRRPAVSDWRGTTVAAARRSLAKPGRRLRAPGSLLAKAHQPAVFRMLAVGRRLRVPRGRSAVDGNTGVSYRFEDGRWMPRYFQPDWRLDVSTKIVWFDPACGVDAARSGPFRYHQRIWFEAARDGGGDVGTRDTLVSSTPPKIQQADRPRPSCFTSGAVPAGTSGRAVTSACVSTASAVLQ